MRRALVSLIIAAALAAAACGEPPNKELQQAEGAIAAARAAGADQYAHEDFQAAVDSLKRAQDAVGEHDYRLALNNALGSRERAENAARLGSDAKAAARATAERTLTAVDTSLEQAEASLKTLEATRATRKAAATLRRAVADVKRDVQKARTAFESGDFPAASAAATAAAGQLAAATRDLAPPTASATRRGR